MLKTHLVPGFIGLSLLLLAACAPVATVARVDELTPEQRNTLLLTPNDPPPGRRCTVHLETPPPPERVLDVNGYRASLDEALDAPADTGRVLLSATTDSSGTLTEFHILRTSLPDSDARLVGSKLEGYLKPLGRGDHAYGWTLRFRIMPDADSDFVRVGSPVMCRPRIRNRYAITLRLENSLRVHPNIADLPDRDRTTMIWVYVGSDGSVVRTEVHGSSGRPDVDHVAIDALSVAAFDPALLDGRPFAAWVSLPFVVKLGGPDEWNGG